MKGDQNLDGNGFSKMQPELIILSIAIVICIVKYLFVSKHVKQDGSPRARQRLFRLNFYYSLFMLGLVCILNFQSRGLSPMLFLCFGIIFISTAFSAFKAPSEEEVLKNYASDPGHCGRCAYDLTGNASGVCSECGWAIPTEPVIVESPKWGLWWREWKIDYLKNWRRTLANTVSFALIFAGLSIFLIYFQNAGPFAILPALMCLQLSINSIRVIQYGQRQEKVEKSG